MKATNTACVDCRFFDQFPIQKKQDNVLGACKANPPSPARADNKDESKLGVWPLVLGDWWCGIFEEKDKSLIAENKN